MPDPQIQDVPDTAVMVAAFRARESARPDPLFYDPFAARLAGPRGEAILASLPPGMLGGMTVVVRTVIIDEYIKAAIARGVDTVLSLGAGLDARPYRMDLPPALRWIEVDFPQMIAAKEKTLADEKPKCLLERESLDLTDRPALEAFLERATAESRSTLVLTEGVLPYLTNDEVAGIAEALHGTRTVHFWIMEYFSREAIRFRARQKGLQRAMQNAPFQFRPGDWFGFFAQRGFELGTVRYIPEEANRLHRPLPFPAPIRIWLKIARTFMSEKRSAAIMRGFGYAMLERVPNAS